jgi:chromosomal replication initiator protein
MPPVEQLPQNPVQNQVVDIKKLWDSVLVEVELNISKANFAMWFRETHIIKIEDGIIYLSVPNIFVKDWLLNKFHKFIIRCIRNTMEVRNIEYVISKNDQKHPEKQQKVVYFNPTSELPLADYYINKDDNLNPRYTFETFVVGPFNELAFAAAQAVAKKPGSSYNPLFLYGDTGRGKTHIIQAIGNYIKTNTTKKVFYATSERFSIDYINAVNNNRANTFKEKYRVYDVLIMDDIQFLSGKEKTQEELFHLFNSLHDDNKQIIFSSDKHPNFIPNLEDRLKSRFSVGMVIDIPHPDLESRASILRAKAKQRGFDIAPEIVDFVASSIDGNIREIEGALNSIIIQTQHLGRELNINEVKNVVKNSAKPKKNVSPKDVIKIIADFYNIEEAMIYEKTRRKEVVKPRQVIMYILREEYDVSYPSIGQKLGGRDHTTVIHSCEKIKNELKTDHFLVEELKQIKSML